MVHLKFAWWCVDCEPWIKIPVCSARVTSNASATVYEYTRRSTMLNGGELRENGKLEVQYIIILRIFKFHVSTIYTFDRL